MESHCNGRSASDPDNSISAAGPAEGRHNGLRFIPLYCNAAAQQFGTDPEWIGYARAAFAEWADRMSPLLGSGAVQWLIADAGGLWTQGFGPAGSGSAAGLPDGLRPQEWLDRLREENGPVAVIRTENGLELALAGLETGDGSTALILGWLHEPGFAAEVTERVLLLAAAGYSPYFQNQLEKAAAIRLAEQQMQQEKEARKKELLFQMVHELYAKNDTDEILSEIIAKIRVLYPDVDVKLLMTQDQHKSNLSVKPLRFVKNEEDLCTRAFMEGRVIIEKRGEEEGAFEMAVPLSGKQGIYGVLHLCSRTGSFEGGDIQLMKVLSGAAGSSFENAKLYEQSNVLVNELRLINELTKQLSQSLKPHDIFNFASSELSAIFHADYCCILQLDKEKQNFIVQATNVPALLYESFGEEYGFAGMVSASREPVIVSDYWTSPPVSSKLMQMTGARSLIAAPLIVQDEVQGVVLVAHRIPGYFTYDNYKLLQVLAGHVGLALANASLHAEVRRMVITDNLTGLYARHYLDEQVGLHQKKDFCGSLIVVDIDHFKAVNDTYGHQVGDQILMQVSRIIRSSIRDSDIAARWGGEELAIYLPQVTTEQALRIAERIRKRVQEETDPSVSVSCGVSEWNWQDEKISVESLFYRSDMALYKAKNEGRNRVKTG